MVLASWERESYEGGMTSLLSMGGRLVVCGAMLLSVSAQALPRLQVNESGRFLESEVGEPFLYLADTAWELFHRPSTSEAETFLKHRSRLGFNVVQAALLAELDGLTEPDAEGMLPLKDLDPKQADRRFFRRVDGLVDYAERQGIYMGLLPTWGDKWNRRWGAGPEIFNPENARAYGEFLGERYKGKNVIWILGGDRNPESPEHLKIIRAMAEGLEKGHGGANLMTYHPMGGSSSAKWFHKDEWLDFNMVQSGHREVAFRNYELIEKNLKIVPTKPTLDGEANYEGHPINWKVENGRFTDADVRRAAWWSLLSGACGHAYGNHNVWQMWNKGRVSVSAAEAPWIDALDAPGAKQVVYLKTVFEKTGWLMPAQFLVKSKNPEGSSHVRVGLNADRSWAAAYIPEGERLVLDVSKIAGKATMRLFSPRSGNMLSGAAVEDLSKVEVRCPGQGAGHDWVVLLEMEKPERKKPVKPVIKKAPPKQDASAADQ